MRKEAEKPFIYGLASYIGVKSIDSLVQNLPEFDGPKDWVPQAPSVSNLEGNRQPRRTYRQHPRLKHGASCLQLQVADQPFALWG